MGGIEHCGVCGRSCGCSPRGILHVIVSSTTYDSAFNYYSGFNYSLDDQPPPYNRVWWKLDENAVLLGILEFQIWLDVWVKNLRTQARRFIARVIFQPCWGAGRWKSKT